jgi:hypothetical protein
VSEEEMGFKFTFSICLALARLTAGVANTQQADKLLVDH